MKRRAIIDREKKGDPGLKADQELGLRAVLAGGFKARLDREGSHSGAQHLKRLDNLLSHFTDFAKGLITTTVQERTTLKRDPRKNHWQLEEPESLAA